ncbi:MAG TPA: toxin-antitoxin system HicB family antitoxin [Thermodesulfobacteriota bacterium]|nr:toxin-antitoxin system HicB family antitoxin [Deltaproteobacteria bacterium]HNR13828.1 toxin-antitoxin system HicB family antitoxin [Thermodesulfobacteriota bacterium]HNU71511.1 toxin-antitoxin system HicB family antitoxin [Thermodesulfobacteriota bacterium]
MKKDLPYYLSLPYRMEIIPIPEHEGGGFMARIPQFGALGIVGDGDTPQEALENLAIHKRERFQQYLEEEREIPEPEYDDDDYSGKLVVRLPKFLHRELAQHARKNGISLNQYLSTLLAMHFQADRFYALLDGVRSDIASLNESISNLTYRMDAGQKSIGFAERELYTDDYPKAA